MKDHSLVWKTPTDGMLWGIPIIVKTMFLMGSWNCKFHAFDIDNGAKLWEFRTSSTTQAPLEPDTHLIEEPQSFTVTWEAEAAAEDKYENEGLGSTESEGSIYGSLETGYMGARKEYLGRKKGYK